MESTADSFLNALPAFVRPAPLEKGWIRLLRFPGRQHPDVIQCELEEHRLGEELTYDALSYSWGDPALTHSIICNGQKLGLHQNLYAALRQFHNEDREEIGKGLLWTDFLCINQEDLEEKAEQVKNMAQIYRNAQNIIIWLGEKRANDEAGFRLLTHVGNTMSQSATPEGRARLGLTSTETSLSTWGLPHWKDRVWSITENVLNRPWFTRQWIIQEFALAASPQFRCGNILVPAGLIAALLNLYQHYNFLRAAFARWKTIPNEHADRLFFLFACQRAEKPLSIPYLLGGSSWFACTDPRDRLFSLVGLNARWTDLVDYKRDWDGIRVDLARRLLALRSDGSFSSETTLLCLRLTEVNGTNEHLPSWVPTWRNNIEDDSHVWPIPANWPTRGQLPGQILEGRCDSDQASRNLAQAEIYESSDTVQRLHVQGIVFDIIKEIATPPAYPGSHMQGLDIGSSSEHLEVHYLAETADFLRLTSSRATLQCRNHRYADIEDCYWRTLCFNTLEEMNEIGSPAAEERACFQNWRDRCSILGSGLQWVETNTTDSWGGVYDLPPAVDLISACEWHLPATISSSKKIREQREPLEARSKRWEEHFLPYTRGRNFVITARGYMGWAPGSARENDSICLFHGDGKPYAMRAVAGGKGYRLLGQSYVHGMMDGEPFDLPDVQAEIITLV